MNSILKTGILQQRGGQILHLALTALCLTLFYTGGHLAAQAAKSAADSGGAVLYQRASAKLAEAEKHLTAGRLSEAKDLVKEANALFTVLQKDSGAALAGRTLTPKEEQQFSINSKLGEDAQLQGDRLMESAAAKEQQGLALQKQGQEEAGEKLLLEAKEEYERAQQFFVRAGIFALKNQQLLFRYLGQ